MRAILVCCAAALTLEAALAPAAMAFSPAGGTPVGFLGLPSLHGIIEAVANGFFSALAKALVPSWLTHGTVATIQHLVALPDPAEWGHVSRLQDEMTYLAAMLAPVTLTVATLRYWTVGLTGAAHPASAIARCAGATGVLVAYRWIVEQVVAATNTLTHGLLGLPTVSAGLGRIIGVLFGGALLSGAGGVFGALLVIVGVILAAGLFATQVLLTVVLAVLIVAGPPLIALAAIPELSHLARAWRDALLVVALVPLGWSVLFATAGALCLDATSFTGGAGGLPGHVAAAFAGLITFALAVKLPLTLLGHVRHSFASGRLGAGAAMASTPSTPAAERVRHAHARLRAIGLAGAPAFGASLGAAAGALGVPAGGPVGAARRRLSLATDRGASKDRTRPAESRAERRGTPPRTLGERAERARAILAQAPREARRAVAESMHPSVRSAGRADPGSAPPKPPGGQDSGAHGSAGERAEARPSSKGSSPARRSASTSRPGSRMTLAAVPTSGASPASGERRADAAAEPSKRPQVPHMDAYGKPPAARSVPDAAAEDVSASTPRPTRPSKPPHAARNASAPRHPVGGPPGGTGVNAPRANAPRARTPRKGRKGGRT